MKGKRILITGGAGFIGSNLVWHLCDANDVIVVDNLSTGRESNIGALVKEKRIEFVRGTITNARTMKKACRDCDFVFHEAAIPSVTRSVKDPLATNDAGTTGTLVTLVSARDEGVRKVVFASSSSVYGETPTLPKREEMVPDPISPYALTKYTGERYCRLFSEIYGLKTVALRYFNVYGPRQNPKSEYAAVIPRFVSRAFLGRELVIYGDGRQTRDFTFVGDAVNANVLAASTSAEGVFNIGSGRRVSINTLAKEVLSLTGSRSTLVHDTRRPGDIKHSLADIVLARESFGYSPAWSLRAGLSETIAYMRQEGSFPGS